MSGEPNRVQLHGEFRIAFENLHLETWGFSIFPDVGTGLDAIAESGAIRTVAAFNGTGNANELRLKELAGSVNDDFKAHRFSVNLILCRNRTRWDALLLSKRT